MLRPPFQRAPLLERPEIRHGFFGRQGGVSPGIYESLQCGRGAKEDLPERVAENRARVAQALGLAPAALVSAHQTHSAAAVVVEAPWAPGQAPEADALVTRVPGIALGILTADCAPVLFADRRAGVVGAAHAGWKGALGGVLEAAVEAMVGLGAERGRIRAAVGPCIAQRNYQVSGEFRAGFLASGPEAAAFFAEDHADPERWRFDLPGYVLARLKAAGVGESQGLGLCTYGAATRYFSNRRAVHWGEPDYGRQLSVVALNPA
ncbi:peptidoglycan editing factor PgeF [Neomegalonema sp.]|uniref:peptidoglycan editing factor PgeF n=1 Tax=Neomegalonema sp. TaxID=2039713 RepID=UPI00260645AA|nr:peptidoglycan editing factor PgeF [Neomegalonema sp.]MDD2868850.1 peptidoglycan editing factor PgeF [Neomegalonema sp.]